MNSLQNLADQLTLTRFASEKMEALVNKHKGRCPICRRQSPALMLTKAYLCPCHGVFEADPVTGGLVLTMMKKLFTNDTRKCSIEE